METRITVLLVEDDDRLATFIGEFLEQNGLVVVKVADGVEALREVERSAFDAMVLDVMLPLLDGYAVCRRVRERQAFPIIMTTARTAEIDRVMGLELGADDYVTKPFSVRELLARIRATVRRARGQVGPGAQSLKVGELELNLEPMTGSLRGRPLHLTTYEFNILRVLAERANRVVSREQLLELAQGSAEESFDRSIDVRISRLRHKLREDSRRPSLLRTVRGAGYMLANDRVP
ncbi:MAG TPA: response regulator transcription factor [Polyangia bacterium]|jgi:DNA-binding response OmpR family regulator|nr:response regulator transcription factor [Polyangia bacterium]